MEKILVIGAAGFVGRNLIEYLLAEGYAVRGLVRDPARLQHPADGWEIVQGDVADLSSVQQAMDSVQAVYIAIHTLSPQSASAAGQRFMSVEVNGLQNIVTACQAHGVRRLIYVTSLGTAVDASSEWLRERGKAEQFLLDSGLDVTVIRPGMIVGAGGRGFDTMASQSARLVAVFLGGQQKMRTIAIDDLVSCLVSVLNDPRAFRQRYDVGNDDVLTNSQMIDVGAEILGRRRPIKLQIPPALLGALAPVIERASKMPKGSFRGLVDSLDADMSGDPTPIRALLPRQLLTYRQAAERAMGIT